MSNINFSTAHYYTESVDRDQRINPVMPRTIENRILPLFIHIGDNSLGNHRFFK